MKSISGVTFLINWIYIMACLTIPPLVKSHCFVNIQGAEETPKYDFVTRFCNGILCVIAYFACCYNLKLFDFGIAAFIVVAIAQYLTIPFGFSLVKSFRRTTIILNGKHTISPKTAEGISSILTAGRLLYIAIVILSIIEPFTGGK